MSELLRAVMEALSVDSRPAFYNLQITDPNIPTAPRTTKEANTFLQMKRETYFLAMGYSVAPSFFDPLGTAAGNGFNLGGVRLVDANSSREFSNLKVKAQLAEFNLNTWTPLGEYILFNPSDLVAAVVDVLAAEPNPPNNLTYVYFLTLLGVEYRIPGESR